MGEWDTSNSNKEALYKKLNQDDLKLLATIFKEAKEQKFTINELEEVLKPFDIIFTRDQLKSLFLKINTSRDDHCDFDEFVSHLIYEFQCDDPNNQKECLNLPIVDKPVLRESHHRFLIVRIRLNPVILPDRSVNYTHANYITVSKDGTINFWTQDFKLQKTEISKSSNLIVAKTWILDLICMPDVSVICTSSIENDLRFYDVAGKNFLLKILITDLPSSISTMNYWFGKTSEVDSKIILGDLEGNLVLIEFNPEMRGPFRSTSGVSVGRTTWKEFCEGVIPEFRISTFPKKHKDMIRQVDYCEQLNCIISAAECREIQIGERPGPGLVLTDLGVQRKETIMRMLRGVSCFAYNASSEIIATGGPDCVLRLWVPTLPHRPVALLHGHNFGITFVFFQDSGQRIYSIDSGKVMKVWAQSEEILQTYILVSTTLTDMNPATHLYNDNTREVLFANMKIVTVKCCPRLNLKKTDGYTHSQPVSVLLYNTLFKTIVSCGFDSCIIVWEPWTGKRQRLIKSAHTRMFCGEILNVEITAGCFDLRELYLLTGARNGTLKMWNLKDGICLRNLSIEYMCEVTAVFWLDQKILAVGWNNHFVEFPDTHENDVSSESNWMTCHVDDVFAAAVRNPEVIVSGSYIGSICFWNLRTGQPFRRCVTTNPSMALKIEQFDKQNQEKQQPFKRRKSDTSGGFLEKGASRSASMAGSTNDRRRTLRSRRISVVQMPSKLQAFRTETVHAMLFLLTRPSLPKVGNLFVAIENGRIQVFSDHIAGGFIDSFNAIHMAGDCVISMATDSENRYLITGTAMGYIKTWLVCNYCVQEAHVVHISMPRLRLEFPFLMKTPWDGRAKRTVRNRRESDPLLVNSYKAHKNMSVKGLVYINDCKLVVSSSTDHSVRIWTLSGRYIGTLGSPINWEKLSSTEKPGEDYNYRIPPDIKRIASSTTLQVLNGGNVSHPLHDLIAMKKHMKAEQARNEEEEKNSAAGTSSSNKVTYSGGFAEPFTGTIPFELTWSQPNIVNSKISGPLASYQPFIPALNYKLDELISKPGEPAALKNRKDENSLGNS
ncbi:hypothetical protein HA402_004215 [Bradysia odoriphaga]|nr:hypothetical protein HA402_004215 [Bradysia odoriphaga]